ncbi:MAG: divalent-cation tolerance protein CutA [Chlamydiae bacterium]|nr:divalent-cation tolerance protein CutA [Chlamydiota bacterium]
MILVYITCKNVSEAQKIGKLLLEEKLCACINILPKMTSLYYWPKDKLNVDSESLLLAKTLKAKYKKLEAFVKRVHSYDNPCIMALEVFAVSKDYLKWLKSQM